MRKTVACFIALALVFMSMAAVQIAVSSRYEVPLYVPENV